VLAIIGLGACLIDKKREKYNLDWSDAFLLKTASTPLIFEGNSNEISSPYKFIVIIERSNGSLLNEIQNDAKQFPIDFNKNQLKKAQFFHSLNNQIVDSLDHLIEYSYQRKDKNKAYFEYLEKIELQLNQQLEAYADTCIFFLEGNHQKRSDLIELIYLNTTPIKGVPILKYIRQLPYEEGLAWLALFKEQLLLSENIVLKDLRSYTAGNYGDFIDLEPNQIVFECVSDSIGVGKVFKAHVRLLENHTNLSTPIIRLDSKKLDANNGVANIKRVFEKIGK
jgi:hypothetical protein